MKKIIHNVQTGEILEVDLTPQDLAQRKIDQVESETQRLAEAAKETARKAVLDKLGLTSEEVAALLQ